MADILCKKEPEMAGNTRGSKRLYQGLTSREMGYELVHEWNLRSVLA